MAISMLKAKTQTPEPTREIKDVLADINSMRSVPVSEKKCRLVNHEIDRMGMGRYQWFVWGLCGFGYLLDLMWAQAFGLVLSPLQQEFGFGGDKSGQISTSFSAGLTAGAAFFGIIVDVVGRKWAFNISTLISSAFGLGLGGTGNYYSFLVLTAFVGFGVGGNIPIDTTITLEVIPQRWRRLLPMLSIFQPIGVVLTTAIAYGFIPSHSCQPDWTSNQPLQSCATSSLQPPKCCGRSNNMGWRYTLFTIGAITLACFFLRFVIFNFRESPKFLINRGEDEKAVQVLQSIAEFNGNSCKISLSDFQALETDVDSTSSDQPMLGHSTIQKPKSWDKKIVSELRRFRLLFSSWTMSRLTILVWLTYFCDFWGFTLAGTYLPTIVSLKNATLSLTIQDSYRDYVYIYLPGVAGVILGVLCYDLYWLGRKWAMVISSGLMGASLFLFATVDSNASNIGLNVMEYFFQSTFNAVLYGWTPEAYPASIRGTACGIASFWGRLSSIVAPIAGQSLLPTTPGLDDYVKLLYLAGGITLGCVVWTALLPSELIGSASL